MTWPWASSLARTVPTRWVAMQMIVPTVCRSWYEAPAIFNPANWFCLSVANGEDAKLHRMLLLTIPHTLMACLTLGKPVNTTDV